jgi:hypothetical protein
MIPLRHSTGLATRPVRYQVHASSTMAAAMNRVPMPKNGGKLASENLMARYVDPHTNQMAARQAAVSGETLFTTDQTGDSPSSHDLAGQGH